MQKLYTMARGRPRPEDAAEAILAALGADLPQGAVAALRRAAAHSLRRMGQSYSSMASEFFAAHVHAHCQVVTAGHLFGVPPLTLEQSREPELLADFVKKLSPFIARTYRDQTKLNKASRRELGIFKGHRWYNKRRRLLLRLEEKISRESENVRRNRLRQSSKTMLLESLGFDDFSAHPASAAFVTYYAARCGLRSTFTNKSQVRAFDDVSSALLDACRQSRGTNWFAVAHVMPDREIVRQLTEEQRGRILGLSFELLGDAGQVLSGLWDTLGVSAATMIVKRGTDSSSWNEAAGAWNRAREHWMSLLHALGMESILDTQLPGKVMRVMAADVARWHQVSGGDVHPDTKVWARLPLPWNVLSGADRCTRTDVVVACRAAGAKAASWVDPRTSERDVAEFQPTPELVHGVAVSSPALAKCLRKLGVFSGKELRGSAPDVSISRDEHGFAVYASGSTPE